MQTSQLFGLSILNVEKKELFAFFDQFLSAKDESSKTLTVFTPNPEQIVMAQTDKVFASNLAKADYLLPDGIGLVCASRTLKIFGKTDQKIKERIAGVDLVDNLLFLATSKELKTLIIGGRDYCGSFEGEAFEDEKSLIEIKKNLFWTEGYQEKAEILPVEEEALAKIIERVQPNLVFVALGAPDQEKWIIDHRALLEANQVKIAMAVGGSFDFLFNKVKRAPLTIQKLGLEWLWRLIQQPWRKHRQLRLIKFISLVFREIF
jgi:N-acetylglucosaminyldiphosphoundecaprenol N-acetyl-beta-D-mannosaminyltransferase